MERSMIYLFDVDGTLTPSRGKMDEEFSKFFFDFCNLNDVYLVTGSDKPKTVEQIGNVIYGMSKRVYNCSGNEVWEDSRLVRVNDWKLPDLARSFLINCEYESQFNIRTGNHIEERSGMVNFSVVGRNASLADRAKYVEYDTKENERNTIANAFNMMFPDLEARPGGETGLDIAPKGLDKSQILVDFANVSDILFFGDRMDEGGNDYPLASALDKIKNGCNRPVKNWQHTWEQLKNL